MARASDTFFIFLGCGFPNGRLRSPMGLSSKINLCGSIGYWKSERYHLWSWISVVPLAENNRCCHYNQEIPSLTYLWWFDHLKRDLQDVLDLK